MSEHTPLPFRVKLCFGIGAIGEAIYFAIFIGFITIFYNQAIGLSNYLIGIATMLAVATDAVTDPFIGMLSDRHRSRPGATASIFVVSAHPAGHINFCHF